MTLEIDEHRARLSPSPERQRETGEKHVGHLGVERAGHVLKQRDGLVGRQCGRQPIGAVDGIERGPGRCVDRNRFRVSGDVEPERLLGDRRPVVAQPGESFAPRAPRRRLRWETNLLVAMQLPISRLDILDQHAPRDAVGRQMVDDAEQTRAATNQNHRESGEAAIERQARVLVAGRLFEGSGLILERNVPQIDRLEWRDTLRGGYVALP